MSSRQTRHVRADIEMSAVWDTSCLPQLSYDVINGKLWDVSQARADSIFVRRATRRRPSIQGLQERMLEVPPSGD